MALRKALTLDDSGNVQQLQAGDTLAGPVAEVDLLSLTNDESSAALAVGTAVYIDAANGVKKAKADAGATARVFGLSTAAILAGAAGNIQSDGVLTGLSGLTAGAKYFLSAATAGAITSTVPGTGYVVQIGIAINTTDIEIRIEDPIKL